MFSLNHCRIHIHLPPIKLNLTSTQKGGKIISKKIPGGKFVSPTYQTGVTVSFTLRLQPNQVVTTYFKLAVQVPGLWLIWWKIVAILLIPVWTLVSTPYSQDSGAHVDLVSFPLFLACLQNHCCLSPVTSDNHHQLVAVLEFQKFCDL